MTTAAYIIMAILGFAVGFMFAAWRDERRIRIAMEEVLRSYHTLEEIARRHLEKRTSTGEDTGDEVNGDQRQ